MPFTLILAYKAIRMVSWLQETITIRSKYPSHSLLLVEDFRVGPLLSLLLDVSLLLELLGISSSSNSSRKLPTEKVKLKRVYYKDKEN